MRGPRAGWVIVIAFAALCLVVLAGCDGLGGNDTLEGPSVDPTTTAATPAETPASTPPTIPPLTPEEVKTLVVAAGLLTADPTMDVFGCYTVDDWATAYPGAEGQDVPLVIFRYQGGAWTIVDSIVGLGWDEVQAQLQAMGMPNALIQLSNPEGD